MILLQCNMDKNIGALYRQFNNTHEYCINFRGQYNFTLKRSHINYLK